MKKINILLSGLLLCTMGLASCDQDQELPPVAYPDGGSAETIGSGAWDNPFSVWQVLAGVEMPEGRDRVWVTGYIVGYINTFDGDYAKLSEKSAVFSAVGAPNSNLLLSMEPIDPDTPAEDLKDYWEKCIPVQLEYGTSGRDLSLQQHPNYLGRQVTLFGLTGDKYLSVYGLRFCSAYNWGDQGIYSPETDGDGSVQAFLTKGLGDCTIYDATPLSQGISYVWEWSNQYGCAKASGYVSSKSYATDSYLITPEITLSDAPYATVDQALNYLRGGVLSDNIGFYIREGADSEWTELSFTNAPDGSSFTFVTSTIDLSAYAGKTVQIALRYQSTTSNATTWEVKNLYIF